MPSTYSPLAIELQATGENPTTWGNITNVNIGTALEEAIVGTVNVPFTTADVTLTLTNSNASQSARHLRLNLTGTPASAFNLIIPAVAGSASAAFEKPYIINNTTGQTITVKHATGTGIAVPTGKTMWVYANGTNVVDVTTHLTSLTLGAFLPIASGGTGGNTAANARTALSAAVLGANSDITSLSGLTTALSIAQGGTGSNTAPLARTALGATTVGGNVFTLTNPSAITFPRFNADNTVTALDAATFRTAIGAGTSSTTGTVTSVGGTGTVNGLTLTGTVTSTGNLTLGGTLSGVSLSTQVTGTLPVANGGTGGTTQATARSGIGAAASGANTDITSLSPTGSLTLNPTTGTVVGSATGGVQGAGTINATGLFVNGAAVGTGSGSVSSVAMSVPAFLSVSGSPITTSGTLAVTLSGTALPVANGGTGQTTYTNGQLLIGNTTGNTLTKATLTQGTGISITNGTGSITIAATGGTGTVTSVGFTGGIVSVATATTTPALTVAGTSGGIPYFSSATTWASSAALAANAIVIGGGAGVAPATTTTGTGVVTALGVNTGTAGAFVVNGGALGTPSSGTLTNCTFPTLNQSTTGSAATLTTARTITIGATGKTFNGSANVSWTLGEIGAAASGANSDITSITLTSGTINSQPIGTLNIVKSTTSGTAVVGDAGKCITVTAGITIPNATFAVGDAISIYNDSASAITITQGTSLTLRLAGTTSTGNRTLAARGMATIWFNMTSEGIISGAGVS